MSLRKLGKILGICSAALLLSLLLLMLAVKLALDRVPAYQAEIKAWVHQQTGLHIRFSRVSPALRWYGPELSFRQLELRSADDRRIIARAARGRIGSDIWRLFSSGKLFAARVELDGPDIVVARTGPTRFALASEIALRGAGASTSAMSLDELPTGQVLIRHGRVVIENWNGSLPRLVLSDVNLDIRRDAGAIRVRFDARLPPVLGGKLSAAGAARGLGDLRSLAWYFDMRTRDISFPGWRLLLPETLARLESGSGAFGLAANGSGTDLARANFEFAATKVVTALSDGSKTEFDKINGTLALTHEGERWTLLGRKVRASRAGRYDPPSNFDATWRGSAAGLLDLRVHASYLRAENLLPLAGLVPQKALRERLLATSPTGEWSDADLRLSRAHAADPWAFEVRAQFRGAGLAPIGSAPGVRGLSGSLAGSQNGGHITLASHGVTLEWPQQWRQPAALAELDGTIYWRRTAADLLFATPGITAQNDDAKVHALASVSVPANGGSPLLTLVGHLDDGNAADAHLYLPRARIHPRTLAWLDKAFVAGSVPAADVIFRGPVRQFPFRDGSGLFLARLRLAGVTLDYGPGWPLIKNADANAEFLNQGLSVHIEHANAGAISIRHGDGRFADFKSGELTVAAVTAGDVSAALRFLRASPLDAKSGHAFSAVHGSGPLRTAVKLFFPFKDFERRRVLIHGQMHGVTLSASGLPLTASGLEGDFTVDGAQLAKANLRGRLLGGAFRAAANAPLNRPVLGTRLRLRGTLDGDALRAALGLPPDQSIRGQCAWRAILKIGAPRAHRRSLRISTNLKGLALDLPQPLGKSAAQPLPSWLQIEWLAAGAPVVNVALGSIVRATFALRHAAAGLRIAHAAVMFGDSEPVFSDTQIFNVRGRIERLDLAGWHKLYTPEENGAPLSKYLRTAHLDVGEVLYGGSAVHDVTLALLADGDHWRVTVGGANAAGTIEVPASAPAAGPWDLRFDRLRVDRLQVASRVPAAAGDAPPGNEAHAATPTPQITPQEVPAIRLRAKRLIWDGRDFGDVQATVSKVDDGAVLDTLTMTGTSFHAAAHGEWRGADAGSGHITGSFASTDVQATLHELDYARVIAAKKGLLDFDLHWLGAPTIDALRIGKGHLTVALEHGQVYGIKPGAGRMLGLASVAALPRRLALDFSDLTDKGLAFDTVSGSFHVHGGNAYTDDVLLKGPAAQIGLIGRIGLKSRDYDQIAVVTGSIGNSLPIAGALAGGPVVGAAVLLFTQVFKQPLRGLARGYYHITGSWDNPTVERISSADAAKATAEARNKWAE
ncbi:MAG TPA: YhdP family protein [Steroidobacteraceae bacterium]|nr:YhdP family protein [Steroidobacteraceae bacterium]